MSSIKRSLGLSFAAQYAELVIQFVGVLILARLITPTEIGIYSVAAFLMAILHVFRDFGVAKYIIQVSELSAEKIRAAFGVAIILAWLIAAVLFFSSGLIARFYAEPAIEDILVIMSASFAVTPLGSLLTAIFRRDLQFKKILIVRVSSALCHVATATTLALAGFGAQSLAWANFAGILAFGVAANLMRSASTPLAPSFRNIREILSFGSVASLGTVAGVAGNNSPDVIIGKAISLAASGYFSRANGMIQMFKTLVTGAVVPLVLPYFSKLRREQGDVVGPYRMAVAMLTAFSWPFFGVLALLALPMVRLLYGPQWDVSVPVVRILCIAGAIGTLATFAGEVMIAYGHNAKVTATQLLTQPVRVAAILAGCPFGLTTIAAGIVLAECFSVAVLSYQLQRTTGVGFGGVLRATARSALVTACSMAVPALVAFHPAAAGASALSVALGAAGALLGWIAGIMWTAHPLRPHLGQARRAATDKLCAVLAGRGKRE